MQVGGAARRSAEAGVKSVKKSEAPPFAAARPFYLRRSCRNPRHIWLLSACAAAETRRSRRYALGE